MKHFNTLLCTLTLTGCALAQSSSMSSTAPITLTVWSPFEGPERLWLDGAVAAFGRERGVKVQVVTVSLGQVNDKLIQAAPRGQGPDLVVTLPHDRIGALVAAGVLAQMNTHTVHRADLQSVALDAMTYRGLLYGLPMSAEAVAVVYNKKLLPSVPSSWDAMLSSATSFNDTGTFGFLTDLSNAYLSYGLISAYGGYVFKNNGGTLDIKNLGIGNAGALRAMTLLNDLRFKYNLIPDGLDGAAAKEAFVKGRAAMYLTGPWDMADIQKANIDYGIALLPTPPGAANRWSPFVGVQGILVSAYSKHSLLAAGLAKALVTSDAQLAFNTAGGRIPISKAALAQLKRNPVVAGFSKAIAVGTPMPNVPQMSAVWGPWTNAMTQGSASADADYRQLLDTAVREIRSNIK